MYIVYSSLKEKKKSSSVQVLARAKEELFEEEFLARLTYIGSIHGIPCFEASTTLHFPVILLYT
jgi:hypothetical protein